MPSKLVTSPSSGRSGSDSVKLHSLIKGQIVKKSDLANRALPSDSTPRTHQSTVSSIESNDFRQNGIDHVKVAIRVRPLNDEEKKIAKPSKKLNGVFSGSSKSREPVNPRAWTVSNSGTVGSIVQSVGRDGDRSRATFTFDSIFDEDATTPQIYESVVGPVVRGVMRGQNGTVFAYGQTGGGKTYTMVGEEKNGDLLPNSSGVIQLAARHLFDLIGAESKRIYRVQVSFIEIYNETVRDLIGASTPGADWKAKRRTSRSSLSGSRVNVAPLPALNVRDSPGNYGTSIGCVVTPVADAESLFALLSRGNHNRSTAATRMNNRSSRSHTIFRINVESIEEAVETARDPNMDPAERAMRVSTLNLVDLAGSENGTKSGTTNQRQREGGKINQSLLSLSQVIQALSLPPSRRPAFINYRDSKLTRILQPHLSGNALLAILCCVSPSALHIAETRSTLRFASRAKLVQTRAQVNEIVDDAQRVKKLQRELLEARKALEDMEKQSREAMRISLETTEELKRLRTSLAASSKRRSETPLQPSVAEESAVLSTDSPTEKESRKRTPSSAAQSLSSIETSVENHSPKHPSDQGTGFDAIQGSSGKVRGEVGSFAQGNSHVSGDFGTFERVTKRKPPSARDKETTDGGLPKEVVIMTGPYRRRGGGTNQQTPTTKDPVPNDNDALMIEFLESRLEVAEDLVESLQRDLESARRCVHELVHHNVRLGTKVEKLTVKLETAEGEADEHHDAKVQHQLLKYSIYVGLFFFIFRLHELFLAAVMFIWLCLEASALTS